MTREEFIRGYCERSELKCEPRHVLCGYIDAGDGWMLMALPCACDSDKCDGWAMISAEGFQHHMQFHAPEELRQAFLKLVPL